MVWTHGALGHLDVGSSAVTAALVASLVGTRGGEVPPGARVPVGAILRNGDEVRLKAKYPRGCGSPGNGEPCRDLYLDVREAGCLGGFLCVSAADNPEREADSSTWALLRPSGAPPGAQLYAGDELHLRNFWGPGSFLDMHFDSPNLRCPDGRMACVTTKLLPGSPTLPGSSSSSLFSYSWRVVRRRSVDDSGKNPKGPLRDGDELKFVAGSFMGGLLGASMAKGGCNSNAGCVGIARESSTDFAVWWAVELASTATRVRGQLIPAPTSGAPPTRREFVKEAEFDYIVVGAGSAGSVAAARLARAGASVALLDAGLRTPRRMESVCDPLSAPQKWRAQSVEYNSTCIWNRHAVRFCHMVQGRVLGGGAAVNAQIYTRAPADDFPFWRREDVSAGYRSLETEIPRVLVSPSWSDLGPGMQTFVSSLEGIVPGLRWRLDPEEKGAPFARISGFYRSQTPWLDTAADAKHRVSGSGSACAAQAQKRSSRTTPYNRLVEGPARPATLRVLPAAAVARLILDDGSGPASDSATVLGVELTSGRELRARKEVLLSAGAMGTPQLLRSSGLAAEWRETSGIDVDGGHLSEGRFPLSDKVKVWMSTGFLGITCRQYFTEIAPSAALSDSSSTTFRVHAGDGDNAGGSVQVQPEHGVELLAFLNVTSPTTADPEASPEFQLYITDSCCKRPGVDEEPYYCVGFGVVLLHPSSPGSFSVRGGADGQAGSHDYEIQLYRSDVRRFERIVRLLRGAANRTATRLAAKAAAMPSAKGGGGTAGLRAFANAKLELDSLMYLSGDAFEYELRRRVTNWNHPSGTCPVGQCVDERLRVLGTRRLRIVDASIFPSPASAHADAAARVVGHLGAGFVLEDATR